MQDLWPSGGVIAFSFKFRGFVSRSYLARGSKGTMRLRRLLLASVAVAAAAPAMAADMALKAPLAPIVDPWVGPYVGGNLGASWGNIGTTTSVAPSTFTGGAITGTFPGGTTSTSLHPNGVIGGGQAGYVGRIAPHWLWGIEADYQWSGEQASGHGAFSGSPACGDPTPASCFSTDTTDITARLSRFGTLRFRTGFEFERPLVLRHRWARFRHSHGLGYQLVVYHWFLPSYSAIALRFDFYPLQLFDDQGRRERGRRHRRHHRPRQPLEMEGRVPLSRSRIDWRRHFRRSNGQHRQIYRRYSSLWHQLQIWQRLLCAPSSLLRYEIALMKTMKCKAMDEVQSPGIVRGFWFLVR